MQSFIVGSSGSLVASRSYSRNSGETGCNTYATSKIATKKTDYVVFLTNDSTTFLKEYEGRG